MVSGGMLSITGWQHDVLGWMFTYLIHSSVLIVGVWVLTRVLPRISLDTKETMWRVALFGGLATSAVQSGFGLTPLPGTFELPDRLVARATATESVQPSATAEGNAVVDRRIVQHQTGELTITTIRQRNGAAIADASREPSPWAWVLLGLVGAGSVFALGRLAFAARRLSKQLQGRRDVIEDPVLESHLALCAKAELRQRPRLTASGKLRSPVALLRNEICLPERAVDSLTPQQQQGLLAHELAHLIRKDPAWRIGVAVFEAAFFFQPLNHLARRKLHEVAEFQCDDWAARQAGTGVHLAKCLAEVASWLEGGPPQASIVTAMAAPSSPIVARITRLLGRHQPEVAGGTATRIGFSLLSLGAVIWLAPAIGDVNVNHASTSSAALASAAGDLHFEDASDAAFDRSTVHLNTGPERVEVKVEARKPAPPLVLERPAIPAPPRRGDRLQIVIRGGWGFGSGLFLHVDIDREVHDRGPEVRAARDRAPIPAPIVAL